MFGAIDTLIPELDPTLRFTFVAAPNPHLVAFVDAYDESWLKRVGKAADRHPVFPSGVNISFAVRESFDGRDWFVRTYERRTGFTASCASGAVAAAATIVELTFAEASHAMRIRTNGGPLAITIDRKVDGLYPTQSGNATYVYERTADPIEVLARALRKRRHP